MSSIFMLGWCFIFGIMGLILGIGAASSYYQSVIRQIKERKMTRFTQKEAIEFLLKDAPSELANIEKWLHSHPEYIPFLLDYFKCRRYALPYEMYQCLKEKQ